MSDQQHSPLHAAAVDDDLRDLLELGEPAPTPPVFSEGLRSLADLLEAHPAHRRSFDEYRHLICVDTREQLAQVVRDLGGFWVKDEDPGDYFGVTRNLGGGVSVYVYVARSVVCEAVKTGTRTVLRPALDAPMVEVEEDIIEWRCPDSLLAEKVGAES